MRWIVILSLLVSIGLILYGLLFNSDNPADKDFYAGIGTATLFFFFIPLFLYYRRKKISAEKYMLTKDSIKKMREHSSNKKF